MRIRPDHLVGSERRDPGLAGSNTREIEQDRAFLSPGDSLKAALDLGAVPMLLLSNDLQQHPVLDRDPPSLSVQVIGRAVKHERDRARVILRAALDGQRIAILADQQPDEVGVSQFCRAQVVEPERGPGRTRFRSAEVAGFRIYDTIIREIPRYYRVPRAKAV